MTIWKWRIARADAAPAQASERKLPQSLRHTIQQAGHEYLPVLFTMACVGSTLLFFLGNLIGTPPLLMVVPTAVVLALCVEWITLVFGQDMQDCLTLHQYGAFFIALLKAIATYSVSAFFMANAASLVWAPHDALLGIDGRTWAWAMAILVFGVQFALKLAPERPKHQRSLAAIAGVISLMAPDASPEEQALLAARMLSAFAKAAEQPQATALPAPDPRGLPVLEVAPMVTNGNSHKREEASHDERPFRG
jgi:hypothetical protein